MKDIVRQYGKLVDDLSEDRDQTLRQMKLFVEVQVNGKQKEITNNINLLETAIQDYHDVSHKHPTATTFCLDSFDFPLLIRFMTLKYAS